MIRRWAALIAFALLAPSLADRALAASALTPQPAAVLWINPEA